MLFKLLTVFARNICRNQRKDLGKPGVLLSQNKWCADVRSTRWRTLPSSVVKGFVSIGCNTFFSGIWNRMLSFFVQITICLFSTSSTFFRYKLLSHVPPSAFICTSFYKKSSFSRIWMKFACITSPHNLTVFSMFQFVSLSESWQWNSLMIFLAYCSVPFLNIPVMWIGESRTKHNVSQYSVPMHQ